MSVLAATEEAVALEVTKRVCCGADVAVAAAKTDTHRVVGMAIELERGPGGLRQIPPPVVVSFCSEQWLRIAVISNAIWRTP